MSSILHISYELRDRKNRKTTVAVKNLINSTADFSESRIIDVIRVNKLKEEKIAIDERGHLVINSFGFPYGFLLTSHLNRVYSFIVTAEKRNLISLHDIDAVHAHKLTFEGYIGYKIHKQYKIPLMITLRNTDFTVLRYRPDLRSLYKEILKSAVKIIYLVPSMITLLKKFVGAEFYNLFLKEKMALIPNIIVRKTDTLEKLKREDSYLFTALSLRKRDVKSKNIKNLFKAIASIKHLRVKLKIAGTGDYECKIREWLKDMNIEDKVELLGHVDNTDIDKYYASAAAFVLPSFAESFGLVYAESLLNCTPILCSKGVLGFEGFFHNVGVAVDPYSVNDIREGLIELITNNSYYRNEIVKLKISGAFDIFSTESVSSKYKDIINEILPAVKTEQLTY